MTTTSYLSSLGFYVPELLVIVTLLGLLFLEACYGAKEKTRNYVFVLTTVGLVATLFSLFANFSVKPLGIFTNAVVIDPFGTMVKILIVLSALFCAHLSRYSEDIYENLKTEYILMILGVTVGGMLLVTANNLLILYLGVEILSVLSYVLASFKKNDNHSSEAGVKYALYGGIAAGVMLFGIAHIYGLMGSIQFEVIAEKMKYMRSSDLVAFAPAFLLFFVGLGFKIATVPFHMWSPDVYEGSPVPVTTFFSLVPKFAAMAAVMRVSFVFFGEAGPAQTSWIGILQVIAALTMTVGNVTAIGQKSLKRMLAYSSISHAGVMLCAVVVLNDIGIQAFLFYSVAYLFMTLVAFFTVSFVSDTYGSDSVERFSGLVKRYPFIAIFFCITLFSLAGLPPFSGFVAKFNILNALIGKQYYGLALVLAMNSVISLYYYTRPVRTMVFGVPESLEPIKGLNFLNHVVMGAMTLVIVVQGIFWESVVVWSQGAKLFLVR